MTIVVLEHALRTNDSMAKFTEIFDFLIKMFETVNLSAGMLRIGALNKLKALIGSDTAHIHHGYG